MLNQLIHNKAEQKRKDKKGWQALVILIEATGTQSQWTCTYECELVPCEGSGRCGQYGATPIIFGTVREKNQHKLLLLKDIHLIDHQSATQTNQAWRHKYWSSMLQPRNSDWINSIQRS